MGEERKGNCWKTFRLSAYGSASPTGPWEAEAQGGFSGELPSDFRKLNINISTIKHLVFSGNEG